MPITDYRLPIDKNDSPLWWGEVADLGNAIIWKATSEVNDILLFGFGVVRGTNAQGVVYPVDANSVFAGIVMATDTLEKRPGYTVDANGRMGWPAGTTGGIIGSNDRNVSIIRKADRIGVPIDANVNAGDPVFMRHAGGTKGVFRGAADATNTIQVPRARFLFSATGSAGTLGTGYIVLEGVL